MVGAGGSAWSHPMKGAETSVDTDGTRTTQEAAGTPLSPGMRWGRWAGRRG